MLQLHWFCIFESSPNQWSGEKKPTRLLQCSMKFKTWEFQTWFFSKKPWNWEQRWASRGHSQFLYHLLIFLRNQGGTPGGKGHCPSALLTWQGGKDSVEMQGQGEALRQVWALYIQGRWLSRIWPFGFCEFYCCHCWPDFPSIPPGSAVAVCCRTVVRREKDDKTNGFEIYWGNNKRWPLEAFGNFAGFGASNRK